MREDGYAAVTSRQLAKNTDMSPQIVYYYFKTMDAVFEAVFSRMAEHFMLAIGAAADSDDPILAMWNINSDRSRAIVITEFMALANHRKSIAALISEFGAAYHSKQAQLISNEIEAKRLDVGAWTPATLSAVMENLARTFAIGSVFDIPAHAEARDFVGRWLATKVNPGQSTSAGKDEADRPATKPLPRSRKRRMPADV